jgi:cyclophilin family peptidyl-prolyl cis-trans isomerase
MLFYSTTCSAKPKTGKDWLVTIQTPKGTIQLVLFDATPLHKENFLKLAQNGFFNGTTFHRIIDNFMIQGGDPNSKDSDPLNDGNGGPGYTIPAEILPTIKHVYGSVAAARMGDQVNPSRASSGSQFYLVENKNGTPFLDGQYTVFGQVVKGLEIIDLIAEQPKDQRDRPKENITMKVTAKKLKRKKITSLTGYTFPETYHPKQ